jgi:hypothetical protein
MLMYLDIFGNSLVTYKCVNKFTNIVIVKVIPFFLYQTWKSRKVMNYY